MTSQMTYDELLRTAQSLSETERLQLVEALLTTLNPDQAAPLEDSWLAEIDRRSGEIDAGTSNTVPWTDVRRRARERANLGG